MTRKCVRADKNGIIEGMMTGNSIVCFGKMIQYLKSGIWTCQKEIHFSQKFWIFFKNCQINWTRKHKNVIDHFCAVLNVLRVHLVQIDSKSKRLQFWASIFFVSTTGILLIIGLESSFVAIVTIVTISSPVEIFSPFRKSEFRSIR